MMILMKKFSLMFILYLLIYFCFLFPAVNRDRIMSTNPLDLTSVFFLSLWGVWLTLGAIWSHEQLESKKKAFLFLRTLPIENKQIVAAKFLLVFLFIVIFYGFHMIWLGTAFKDFALNEIVRGHILNIACFSLVISGAFYSVLIRLGFDKFGKYLFISSLAIVISPLLLKIFLFPKLGITTIDIFRFVNKINPPILTFLSVSFYLLIFRYSSKTAIQKNPDWR